MRFLLLSGVIYAAFSVTGLSLLKPAQAPAPDQAPDQAPAQTSAPDQTQPSLYDEWLSSPPWKGAVSPKDLIDHIPKRLRPFVMGRGESKLLPNGDVVDRQGVPYNLFKWPFPVDPKKDGTWNSYMYCNSYKASEAYFKAVEKGVVQTESGPVIDDSGYRDLVKSGQCFGALSNWEAEVPKKSRVLSTPNGPYRVWDPNYREGVFRRIWTD